MTGGPILIMAGGTGGHVIPALSIADALRRRDHEVVWLGTRQGLEAELVPAAGIPIEWVRVAGVRGKGVMTWLLAPFRLAVALLDALAVLRRRRPRAVLGMGGFASGPGGLAAWLLRRPLLIHEQNSVAGLTNRLLAGLAREVMEAFPGSFPARIQARLTGNPVRAAIASLPVPGERLARGGQRLRLLVLGGSQGAKVLNEIVPQAIGMIPESRRPEVRHQAGRQTCDIARAAYEAAGLPVRPEPFIQDIAEAYGWADLVVCRAGALTVSELAAAGVGAVLVPFPAAVDDHQTRNAEFLVRAGAAVMIPQDRLTADALTAEIEECIAERALVIDRGVRARHLARPEATELVAERCIALAKGAPA